MLEIGLFHNGASSLPVITNRDGVTFNDGTLPEVHRAAQETLVNQVRQGILRSTRTNWWRGYTRSYAARRVTRSP
jgi:hypothetical protein